jgi:hypothetical protein
MKEEAEFAEPAFTMGRPGIHRFDRNAGRTSLFIGEVVHFMRRRALFSKVAARCFGSETSCLASVRLSRTPCD